MTRLVTCELAITANISMFSKPHWNACQANITRCPAFDMIGDKNVIHINMQFGASLANSPSFGNMIGNQIMPEKDENSK